MFITRYLDPTNDEAFKRIFGREKNKDILIHFLNYILSREGEKRIKEVAFLDATLHPDIAENKLSIIDILCTDQKGTKYIVEMQVAGEIGFLKRAQYYAAQVYTHQSKKGTPYVDLNEVIFLAIVDFTLFPNKNDYKSEHRILDKKTLQHDLQDFSFVFLELKKFSKSIEELQTNEDRWCYFFKHTDEPHNMQKLIQTSDRMIKKAYDELCSHNWTDEELRGYEKAERARLAVTAQIDYARIKGKEEGKEEGIIEGRQEGIQEGILKGKREIAKALLARGQPIQDIMDLTGLSRTEIEQL
jgi:predicted transposase/invertase (TIGR01784 family)